MTKEAKKAAQAIADEERLQAAVAAYQKTEQSEGKGGLALAPSTLLDEALAAERRATVERIRERLIERLGTSFDVDEAERAVFAILDEEAAR